MTSFIQPCMCSPQVFPIGVLYRCSLQVFPTGVQTGVPYRCSLQVFSTRYVVLRTLRLMASMRVETQCLRSGVAVHFTGCRWQCRNADTTTHTQSNSVTTGATTQSATLSQQAPQHRVQLCHDRLSKIYRENNTATTG